MLRGGRVGGVRGEAEACLGLGACLGLAPGPARAWGAVFHCLWTPAGRPSDRIPSTPALWLSLRPGARASAHPPARLPACALPARGRPGADAIGEGAQYHPEVIDWIEQQGLLLEPEEEQALGDRQGEEAMLAAEFSGGWEGGGALGATDCVHVIVHVRIQRSGGCHGA